MEVELLNLKRILQFQTKNNHNNQKILIMIIIQMINKRKRNQRIQPEVNESFKSNSSLKKVTKRALRNKDVKREYTHILNILKRIGESIDPMDIV